MSEIEDRLRAAMHAAVDHEEMPRHLVRLVMRRQRRRRALVACAVVLVALAVAVPAAIAVRHLTKPGPPPATHHPEPPPKALPTKLAGQPWPSGTNLQLLVTTNQGAGQFSTAMRRTEPITGWENIGNGYFFFRVDGGWTAGIFRHANCPPLCATPQYFIADGSLHATRIGAGWSAQASDRVDAVWLSTYPTGHNIYTTSGSAQLVTTAGKPLSPRYRLPAAYQIDRGVGSYLLLEHITAKPPKPPYVYELWDPRTGKVIRSVDNVAAAGPDLIAWSSACAACKLQVLNVSTGKSVTTSIPGGQSSGGLTGLFSDDGRLLALYLPSGGIGVYDTVSHGLTVIPGTALGNAQENFEWLDGGHRLVIVAAPGDGNSNQIQVAYWQPGDTRLRLGATSVPGGIVAVVIPGAN